MTNKLIPLFYLLSMSLFCCEISILEFLQEEKNKINDPNIFNFILIQSEKSLKDIHEESLENIFLFSYLLCTKLIDFMLVNEDKLSFKNNELGFLKADDHVIGTIKNYLKNSINQEMNTILAHKRLGTGSGSTTDARIRRVCVLLNRLAHRLLMIVFDFEKGAKPQRSVTIENLWEKYIGNCSIVKEKNSANSQSVNKYSKLCKKNDALLLAINSLHGDFKNQKAIVNVVIKLIKAQRNIVKFES